MKGHEFNFGHAELEAPLNYLSRNINAIEFLGLRHTEEGYGDIDF